MQAFLAHFRLLFLHPRESFRRAAAEPRPWAGAFWGLLPALLAMFLTSWAATRRGFDPFYSGMAGMVFGGAWVISLGALAVAARLLGGRPKPEVLTEAGGLAWTPVLVGMLLFLPVFLTTEGRNFAVLQQAPLLAVAAGAYLWGAVLSFFLFREVAGLSPKRAVAAYLVSLAVSALGNGVAGWLLVWTN